MLQIATLTLAAVLLASSVQAQMDHLCARIGTELATAEEEITQLQSLVEMLPVEHPERTRILAELASRRTTMDGLLDRLVNASATESGAEVEALIADISELREFAQANTRQVLNRPTQRPAARAGSAELPSEIPLSEVQSLRDIRADFTYTIQSESAGRVTTTQVRFRPAVVRDFSPGALGSSMEERIRRALQRGFAGGEGQASSGIKRLRGSQTAVELKISGPRSDIRLFGCLDNGVLTFHFIGDHGTGSIARITQICP